MPPIPDTLIIIVMVLFLLGIGYNGFNDEI